jgi:hypothetical protein
MGWVRSGLGEPEGLGSEVEGTQSAQNGTEPESKLEAKRPSHRHSFQTKQPGGQTEVLFHVRTLQSTALCTSKYRRILLNSFIVHTP